MPRAHAPPARTARLIGAIAVFGAGMSLFLQSWRYGLLVTVTFAIHELGHILALAHHGIDWEIRLSLLGVATISPQEARAQLGHFANSQIHLAGPLVNLLQALFALLGYALTGGDAGPQGESWLIVANLASLLVLLNLLPLGALSDGGKFIRRLFASLTERAEERVIWSLLLWLLSLVWLIVVTWGDTLRTLGTLAVVVWFVLVTLLERQRDGPAEAYTKHSMTRRQGLLLFSAVSTALLWATGITILTPFWLRPEHLETMARNIAIIVVTLQRSGVALLLLLILAAVALPARLLLRRR